MMVLSPLQWAQICGICSWKDSRGMDGNAAMAVQAMREQTQQHLVEELFVRRGAENGSKEACFLFDKHVNSGGVSDWMWKLQDGLYHGDAFTDPASHQFGGQVFCQELDEEDSRAEFIIRYSPDETSLVAPYLFTLDVLTNQSSSVDIPCAGQEQLAEPLTLEEYQGSEQFSVESPCWLSVDQTMKDLPDYCLDTFEDSGCYDMDMRAVLPEPTLPEDGGAIQETTASSKFSEAAFSTTASSSKHESFSKEAPSSPKLCIEGDDITWDDFVPAKTIMVEVSAVWTDYCYRIVLGRGGTFDQMETSSCPDNPEDYQVHYHLGTYDDDADSPSMALEYTQGYYCNVIGDARSGHVQLSASKSITEPVVLVEEMETCKYLAEIQLPFCSNMEHEADFDSDDVSSSSKMESNDAGSMHDSVDEYRVSDDEFLQIEPMNTNYYQTDDDLFSSTPNKISAVSNTKTTKSYMRPLGQRDSSENVMNEETHDYQPHHAYNHGNEYAVMTEDESMEVDSIATVVLLYVLAFGFACGLICCVCCMCTWYCCFKNQHRQRIINDSSKASLGDVQYSMIPLQ